MKLLACILIALAVVGIYGDEPDQLVNGIPSSINDYPHCISLRRNNAHMCGGSIIDRYWILTAAHCVMGMVNNRNVMNSMTVVAGTTYLNQGGQPHKIAKVFYHENYNPNLGRAPNDIALIKLETPISLNSVQQAVPICKSNVQKDDAVTIAAWGSTGYGRPIHNNLQKLHAKAMLAGECRKYHDSWMNIAQNELCTLIVRGTGLCHGDSGSGLIRDKDKCIIGLVSGGKPCATGAPDVYSDCHAHLGWIERIMASN